MKQESYKFYETSSTYQSASVILPSIMDKLAGVTRIMDIGCGVGGFTKAFEDIGITDYTLVDHPSINPESLMPSNKKAYVPCDLDIELPEKKTVDLIVCTEVLEHINNSQGVKIVKYMCECSDLVLFSAAIPRQGGLGHINEQRHNHWHNEFKKFGFNYYDGFKSDLFEKSNINYWLVQNLFIYYSDKKQSSFDQSKNISSNDFELVSNYVLNKKIGIREAMSILGSSFSNYLKRKF